LVPIFIRRFVEHFGDEGGLFSYCGRREGRQVRGNRWLVKKRELIIDPGLENASAQAASHHRRQIVLESCSPVALRLNRESLRWALASAKP
jgi:hypothetical protein